MAGAQVRPAGGTRLDVQGLRALAVLLVMLAHVGVPWLSGGFIGVDVFFVVSGFLITGLLLREREATGRIRLGAFCARRARPHPPGARPWCCSRRSGTPPLRSPRLVSTT